MWEHEDIVVDSDNQVLSPGDFVELLESVENILKGPIKYEGWRHCSPVWSVGGAHFISSALLNGRFRKLPWRRWRNGATWSAEFWSYVEKSSAKALGESAISSKNAVPAPET